MKLLFFIFALSFMLIPQCHSTTIMHLRDAARNGDLHKAQEALHNGANINDQSIDTWTPLHLAAAHGHIKLVELLLDADAVVNVQNNTRSTPLHEAVYGGHTTIVKLLLEAGARINLQSLFLETALDMAKRISNDKIGHYRDMWQNIAKMLEEYPLLQKEVQENHTGETLRKAIENNYTNIVKLLLQKCIAVDKADLELAKQLNNRKIGLMLVKYLGATTGQYYISKHGIVSTGITPDSARIIMSNTL